MVVMKERERVNGDWYVLKDQGMYVGVFLSWFTIFPRFWCLNVDWFGLKNLDSDFWKQEKKGFFGTLDRDFIFHNQWKSDFFEPR